MYDLIIHIISVTSIIWLSFMIFKYKKNQKILNALFIQIELERQALQNEIVKIKEAQLVEQNDGFVKFLSQSRDWAFTYIEQVQDALKKFDEIVAPNLKYARTFGKVTGDNPNSNILEKIDEAYAELSKMLPKDN